MVSPNRTLRGNGFGRGYALQGCAAENKRVRAGRACISIRRGNTLGNAGCRALHDVKDCSGFVTFDQLCLLGIGKGPQSGNINKQMVLLCDLCHNCNLLNGFYSFSLAGLPGFFSFAYSGFSFE